MHRQTTCRVLCFLMLCALWASPLRAGPIKSVSKSADGVSFALTPGTLRLAVMSDSVIRVTYGAGDSLPTITSYTVIAKADASTKWAMRETPDAIIIETQM